MSPVSSIIDSVEPFASEDGFQSVSDRYYEHRYCARLEETPDVVVRQRVSFHSNRICLLSLAPDHPVIKDDKSILRLNCSVGEQKDRARNNVSGKGKRGAQRLTCGSVLCYIECEDGSVHPVRSCVRGKLIEVNEHLLKDPNLLKRKPTSDGYIALVLPTLDLYDECRSSLLTHDEYINVEQ